MVKIERVLAAKNINYVDKTTKLVDDDSFSVSKSYITQMDPATDTAECLQIQDVYTCIGCTKRNVNDLPQLSERHAVPY